MVINRHVVCMIMQFVMLKAVPVQKSTTPVILYGTRVKIEDFPYFAATEVCGASILSERWLLTAAHCVDNRASIANRMVFVGGERIDNSLRLRYNKIYIHPQYTRQPITNDIALLQLETPLRFSSKVKPIRLPRLLTSSPLNVFIGRGKDETHQPSIYLMKMDVIRMSPKECIQAAGSQAMHIMKHLTDQTIICGMKVDGRPGICFGDSGSPLIQNNMIVGLASFLFGQNCHNTNVGYYTNVAAFVPWITSITGLK